MFLIQHTADIFDLAKAQGVDIGTGRDMFIADCEQKKDAYAFKEMDFESLGEEWAALTPEEQTAEKNIFSDFVTKYYHSLTRAYRTENYFDFVNIVTQNGA